MKEDKREAEQTQPKPAKGQIWKPADCPREWTDGSGLLVVVGVDVDGIVDFGDGLRAHPVAMALAKCVGIETPAGRVMVGERREAASDIEYRVHHVVDGKTVWVEDGVYGYGENAKAVASWPLLPPLAQGPLTSDTIPRPSGCRCQWEQGDSECAVHSTCGECGCVVCECEPKGLPCRLSVMGRGCEGGPGIARLDIDIPEPTVAPDVVYTWEAWALP